jgi:predicted Fe-Mo cluster-binding NifX family protein
MVRLVIPVESFENERSVIFPHFGRAPEFAVIEISNDGRVMSMTSQKNVGEHFGGQGGAEPFVTGLGPDALVVKGMGPRGLQAFQSNGIAVFTGPVNNVGEAIESYLSGRLSGLTEPCRDARHKFPSSVDEPCHQRSA